MKWLSANPVRGVRLAIASGLLFSIGAFPAVSRADTVASLLGNFTINQYCGVRLLDESVEIHYVVVFGQLPALRELHVADINGDGVTSQSERDEYVRRLAPDFARQLKTSVDGVSVPLRLRHWTSSLPTEQGGFSLRLDADFSGTITSRGLSSVHKLQFVNRNYPGRFGWREITVQSVPSIRVFDSNSYATSLTAGLTEALKVLPATGPLDETSAQLSFTHGSLPAGARPIQQRSDAVPTATGSDTPTVASAETAWLQIQTRRLVSLISTPTVAPHIAILALLIALVLGAIHALSPGHGKTIVGAYLIGSRGTPKHAAFLGLTVTVTHTLGVFALGFATLVASRFIVPEKLFPLLSLVSGLLVFGMGLVLIAQRWRAARRALMERASANHGATHPVFARRAESRAQHVHDRHDHVNDPIYSHVGAYAHSHGDDHTHTHDHGHGYHYQGSDDHGHGASITHSHGGTLHSHMPPSLDGGEVTWRSLLALGISGGLIPCPSAMVLLLAAVALNKTLYGLLLVLAFSVGLAITLTGIGLAFLYARNKLRLPRLTARWPHLLPVLSAGIITLIGAILCFNALQSARL